MDEDLILQQPVDRRIAGSNVNTLPSGPPGAEPEFEEEFTGGDTAKSAPKPPVEKETSASRTSSRRRTPSPPSTRRKSPSRSPLRHGGRDRYRGRVSPSPPRRNRYRDYSPDRRRRRTPDRRRSRSPPPRRRGDRDRYRGGRRRSISRSRSRSLSPMRRGGGIGGGGSRWSPKRKPNSPLSNAVPPPVQPPQPTTGPPPPQYGVMPPQMYGGDAYGPAAGYNQYGVPPPPQQAFAPQPPNAYGAPPYNTAFPPPNAWGVNDAYAQQSWMQPPVGDPSQQMAQMPPTVAPPPTVVVPTQMPPMAVTQSAAVSNLNALPDAAPGTVDPNPTHDAVAQEAEHQRDELKKQRTSYLKKTAVLKKELRMLKEQRKDFNTSSAPPSPTTKGFIDENEKLQNQILKKISTIENVIDMLTGIIGEENLEKDADMDLSDGEMRDSAGGTGKQTKYETTPGGMPMDSAAGGNGATAATSTRSVKKKKRSHSSADSTSDNSTSSTSTSSSQSSSSSDNDDDDEEEMVKGARAENDDDDDTSSERLKHKAMESMKSKQNKKIEVKDDKRVDERKRFNYVFYDPEMHWCQTCDIFPKTAKDYLNHLHTKEHINRESMETPWHSDMINDQYPSFDNAPTKRTPIRGLTFFVPATAWFCKLCNIWMGDLHCASTHLKSQTHSNKYNVFLEKNPHFEVNWLADRQRVLNEKKTAPLPPQITSVSTTAAERSHKKSSKRDEDKTNAKKRKKRTGDKKDKKKKKKKQRSKKRKKNTSATSSSSSSSSESSSSDDEDKAGTKKVPKSPIIVPELNNPDPAASIRVAMRRREHEIDLDSAPAPPPPPPIITEMAELPNNSGGNDSLNGGRIGKWITTSTAPEITTGNALMNTALTKTNISGAGVGGGAAAAATADDESKRDDAIIQQWNVVQPVISESEKKLLEQLKGKLKNKPREELITTAAATAAAVAAPPPPLTAPAASTSTTTATAASTSTSSSTKRSSSRRAGGGGGETDRRRRSRSSAFGSSRRGSRGRQRSRSRGRSRSRSRSRGGWGGGFGRRGGGGGGGGGGGRRSRSRSRGRRSRSFDRRRRVVSRSRSRSARRRSRSYERRRGRVSRSRSRSISRGVSKNRIEKPVIKHSEFRPRVPERDREKEKDGKKSNSSDSKDKRDGGSSSSGTKKSKSSNSAALIGGKKLPFIGKMPVFKKQVTGSGQPENGERRADDSGGIENVTDIGAATQLPPPPPPPPTTATAAAVVGVGVGVGVMAPPPLQRVAAPTAAQIQMAMMEDAFGNAPPFHPDAGIGMNMMMVDYDDLMPDPVQFVNLMGQAPPPPPPLRGKNAGGGNTSDEDDDAGDDSNILPPGIDETESEEFVPKPISDSAKGSLPKDLEEALNIIFPGEKTAEEEAAAAEEERKLKAAAAGETQIIMDEPIMQAEDLVKEGIHMVTIEETSMAMDDASQLSMNEPLIFSKPSGHTNMSAAITTTANITSTATTAATATAAPAVPASTSLYEDDASSQNAADIDLSNMMPMTTNVNADEIAAASAHTNGHAIKAMDISLPNSPAAIPMPDATMKADTAAAMTAALVYDLDDIPQPPDSPTESEKQRRQEELDDLAMLGIDADDMAAQCM